MFASWSWVHVRFLEEPYCPLTVNSKRVPFVSLASDVLKQLQLYPEPSHESILSLAKDFFRPISQSHRNRTFLSCGEWRKFWVNVCHCHEQSHVRGPSASDLWELAKPSSGLWMNVYERLPSVCRTYQSRPGFILRDDSSLRLIPIGFIPRLGNRAPGSAVYNKPASSITWKISVQHSRYCCSLCAPSEHTAHPVPASLYVCWSFLHSLVTPVRLPGQHSWHFSSQWTCCLHKDIEQKMWWYTGIGQRHRPRKQI